MRGFHDRKRNILLTVTVIMTIVWMGMIFSMSAAKGEASSSMSMRVGHAVGHLVVNDFSSLSKKEQNAFAEKISFPVRKTAHFLEYAVLGGLLAADVILVVRRRDSRTLTIAAGAGFLYACSDEFHQMFVAGRSAQVSDIILDTCGVLFGAGILFLFCRSFVIMENTEQSVTSENKGSEKNEASDERQTSADKARI